MSEFQKVIISFIMFICWSVGCFCGGYVLSNRRAVERINDANRQLTEQQQKYDIAIEEARERLSEYRELLHRKVSDNGQTIAELSGLVEQIRKQKLDI